MALALAFFTKKYNFQILMERKLYLKPTVKVVALLQESPILAESQSVVDISRAHNCVKDPGAIQYSQKKQSHPIWGNMEP